MSVLGGARDVVRAFLESPARRTVLLAIALIGTTALGAVHSPWWLLPTAATAWYAVRYKGDPGPPPSTAGTDRTVHEYDDVPRAAREVTGRYSDDALDCFLRVLCALPDYLSLADERATVQPSGLRLETRLDFRLEPGDAPTVLVPLIQTSKGSLIDGLEIVDGKHDTVAALSPYETRGLVGWAVDCLVRHACTRSSSGPPSASTLDPTIADLMRVVCRPGAYVDDRLDQRLLELLNRLDLAPEWHGRLHRFCFGLAQSQLLVVEADRPRTSQLTLVYRQLLSSESTRTTKPWRTRLGLVQDTIDAPPMVYAARAQSYHFQLAPAPGRYVYSHVVEANDTGRRATADDLDQQLGPVDQRDRGDGNQRQAHWYITPIQPPRSRNHQSVKDYKCAIEFREIPPGALGGATLISTATAVMTAFFALSRVGLDKAAPLQGADIPALLIALPAFTAILVGHWSDTSQLPKSSVSAYVGLLGTMLISLLSSLTFLLDSAGKLGPAEVRLPVTWGDGTIASSWPWLVLAALALTQTLYLWLRLRQAGRYYHRQLASESGPPEPTGRTAPPPRETSPRRRTPGGRDRSDAVSGGGRDATADDARGGP